MGEPWTGRNGTAPHGDAYPLQQRGDADEADHVYSAPDSPETSDSARLPIVTAGDLVAAYPTLRPPLIDGLLRLGETANVIAAPKVGKSWLTYGLAIAVATGRRWLDIFPTSQGDVLLIDNELHAETLAHRLPKVAEALNVPWADVCDHISVLSLRGRLQDLQKIGPGLAEIGPGRFKLVITDAAYRALPSGADENDHATMTGLYNAADTLADALRASLVFIHHASKGDQSAKTVTHVGSGAGSQSRAVDTHIILRPHEEEGAVVLEAAVRSFPPVPAEALRWSFPVWTPDPTLDATKLRGGKPRRRRTADAEVPTDKPGKDVWSAQRFAATFGTPSPQPRGVILETAELAGLSDRKANDLLKRAIECGYLDSRRADGQANRYFVPTDPPQVEAKPDLPVRTRPQKRSKARIHTRVRTPPTPPWVWEPPRGGGV